MLTMQDALLALTRYWAEQGCLVAQPMNTEVGAGTLNPATSLRVLGPEQWRVAYVEPSVRPADSRYGENPNRIQTHTQFQVILKPEPGDPQELYLGSLRVLGIDTDAHDVRFVEDDWASPALGAWGLGWEVWLDGLEITQFTYFQQAGGVTLDPVSVELTYGMERILMGLQEAGHFRDIAYAPGFSYGEVVGQTEYEMSRYYLDDADVATNRTLFESYEAEARRMLDARLPVPAHSYVLKCSHTFNVLDSRGAISPTERARAFARMRDLSHEVAELWIARREEEGHPLGVVEAPSAPPVPETLPEISGSSTLAFEIGVEELPPAEVPRTAEAVRAALADKLAGTRLAHGPIGVYASPRRVVALVEEIAPREDDDERWMRGPKASAAFDEDGAPTKAALGFARGQGADVTQLERLDVGGVEYVGITRHVPGRAAAELMASLLPEIVSGLRADKNMRWRAPGLSFARPIRWIVALLGDSMIPFTVSSLASGRTTRVGHTEIDVDHASGYLDTLARSGVTVDPERRRQVIETDAQALASDVGGQVDASAEDGLIDEVTNLVEQPTVLLGGFDEHYLDLPAEVLTTVMRGHQRYLPVRDTDGGLLPYFITVADGACDRDLVRAGNEAVLRARYDDASFFWHADLRVKPDDMKAGLAGLTFEQRLGSMADRAARIATIAENLARSVDLPDEEHTALTRAGQLAKFDLASQMVTELPTLAGVMAREYTRQAGEPEPVAQALFEMELPRHAGDALPQSLTGALLALADRLDLLAGLFALGAIPTGSSDPFGLRRAALGVVSILRANPRLAAVTIPAAISAAGQSQPVPWTGQAQDELRDFVTRRYEQQLRDAGHGHKVVRAVLPLASTPRRADTTLAELGHRVDDPDFARLVETMQRVRRILPPDTDAAYDPGELYESAEAALHQTLVGVRAELDDHPNDLARFTDAAQQLTKPVEDFFTDVLVNADDSETRANRLGLLAAIRDLSADVLDWRALD